MVDEESSKNMQTLAEAQKGQVPFGTEFYVERQGSPILVKRQVVLTGDRLTDAQAGFDNQTQEPAVHLTLDATGARIFRDVTRENIGNRMAILLFEKGKGEVVTAPVIRSEIGGGRVQISGGRMSTVEANDIALLLRSGALAAPMEIVEERTVGPSLGRENIEKGFNSTVWGFVAIAAFMIVYYLIFGLFSSIALAANLLLPHRPAVAPAGDADLARHRGDRAHARHGDRRERADQRAHPRGAARRRDAAGRDPRRLRARFRDDRRLERDHADRRPRAPRLRLGAGTRLRRRALPRHPDLDVLRGRREPHAREPLLRLAPAAGAHRDREHVVEVAR